MNPNLVLESVRFGKPFICTKETGVGEVLDGCGIFIDPHDATSIAKAFLELSKPEVYERCRKAILDLRATHTYADIAVEILSFAKKFKQ
jgi:glycosyltransferase involved in cell wall biosynthesis